MRSKLTREVERLRDRLGVHSPVETRGVDVHEVEEYHPANRVVLCRRQTAPDLFDYQEDLASAMLRDGSGGRFLLSLPTGAGKTRTAAVAALRGMAHQSIRQCAWLAPSVELIDQASSSLEDMWFSFGAAPDLTIIRGFSSEPPDTECLIALITPQAIYSRVRRGMSTGRWDLIVFDEAHQLGARTFRAAAESMTRSTAGSQPATLVGLSATPGRVSEKETEDLVTLFDGNLLTSGTLAPDPVRALQRRGVLAELQFRRLTGRAIPSHDEPARLVVAARACVELTRRGHRILVFTGSVAGAVVLAEVLLSKSVAAAAVHAGTPIHTRREVISQFERGDIHVLTNQRLLATGYDCPAVTDVVILPRIQSPILFEQIVGRAARGPRTGGWRSATVWDFDDHLQLHGRPQSYYRYRDFDWS